MERFTKILNFIIATMP